MQNIHQEQINQKYIVQEGLTSIYIFIFPVVVLILSLVYIFNFATAKNNIIVMLVSVPLFIISGLNYLNKKIILTKSTLYHFLNKKCNFSVKLTEDFKILYVEQDRLGKLLNYGTVYIFNNKDEFVEYKYLDDPLNFKKKFVKVYVEEMKKIDPSYEISDEQIEDLEDNNSKKIDRVD